MINDDPFPFDLPVEIDDPKAHIRKELLDPSETDDPCIPAFLRLTAEQRAEAWKGRKLTKPGGDIKRDYTVPRSLDAAGKAIMKDKRKAEADRLKSLRKRS